VRLVSSVLVLDDRATERELLVTVLTHIGHEMFEASTGEAALELAREVQPELIIVDLMMPGMSGPEFVRELRGDPDVGQTRVVFHTATYDEEEIRRLADTAGVSHILPKPSEPEQIISVVTEALSFENPSRSAMLPEEFDREQLRVLNTKLVQKVSELEVLNAEQILLHERLRQAQRQTAESLTLLETLQSSAPVGFGFVDREFRIVRINETLTAIAGIAEDQIGRTIAEIMPDMWPDVEHLYKHVLETGEPVINRASEREDPSRAGEARHLLVSYYPVRLGDEVIGIGLVVIDITERQQAEDLRAVVMENIAEGIYVTDAQGRLVYMNPSASRMTGWREDDLRGKSVHAAIHHQHADGTPFAEHDCQLMRALTDGRTVHVADDAFTRSDGAVFHYSGSASPLRSGTDIRGSVVVFRDTTDEHAEQLRTQRELDALTWVGRLRDALDDERLVLYAQPIVALSARAQATQELLIRMVGRGGQVIAPGSFLPTAEKYGQIGELDRWVISQAARIGADGTHLHANLSASSIGSDDLLHHVEEQLAETGTDPANIVFEITETALMRNAERGQAFARGITDIGCGLALDDFGTGYGSLTYLQKLPITYLKIDIAFVQELATHEPNQHLVKAIVSMAEGFGQQTIAEGVEDAGTLDLLREFGVDLAQGYLLGRPAPLAVA
jgi:PAS domain S-box-containing protein